MVRILANLLIASVALGAYVPTQFAGTAAACATNDEYMQGFLGFVRIVVSERSAESQASRKGLGIPEMKPERVAIVQVDSLCARAALMLNRDNHRPDSTSIAVYLLAVGDQYWAEDKTQVGEWQKGLLMNAAMTKIIKRPGR